MWRKLLTLSIVVLLLGAATLVYGVKHWANAPLTIGEEKIVYQVGSGSSLIAVARDLSKQHFLRLPRLLSLYARATEQTNIKPGEYFITQNDTPVTLLSKLVRGDVIVYNVTIIEGWTFKQMLDQLHQQEKLSNDLSDQSALDAFLATLELDGGHPEGWFFPDTYTYVAGASDKDILRQANGRMHDVLATEWENRVGALPYDSPYQALIMASIVERETGLNSEREQIAGVFVRRLEQNMRLQTDPTVIYGMGENYQGNIRRSHLSEPTPYNTYLIRGLPPTPIALPGREAIYAALHPDDGGALYFVARGDGSHQFSETLEAHNQAVQEYQIKKRVENYRSSPEVAE